MDAGTQQIVHELRQINTALQTIAQALTALVQAQTKGS